eukprot:8051208-Pyramimonas_sp.AAC.1
MASRAPHPCRSTIPAATRRSRQRVRERFGHPSWRARTRGGTRGSVAGSALEALQGSSPGLPRKAFLSTS